jgi:bifunctional non-homologous end joining protein LigD
MAGYTFAKPTFFHATKGVAVGTRKRQVLTPDLLTRLRKRLRPSPMPAFPKPMLCTLVDEPFDNPLWVFEPKFDGLRVLGRFDGRQLKLLSRNEKSLNPMFPDVVGSLKQSLKRPAIVDGEIVCLDEQGRSSFRLLQQRFHLKDPREIQARMEKYPAIIYLFDLLYLERHDLAGLPLGERKALLHDAVRWSDGVRWTPGESGKGRRLWAKACRQGSEGVIGKELASPYVAGRSDRWMKIKCIGRQEFVIGGFTDPQRSRVGLGALLAGYYSDDGKRLIYAGKVGTGYTSEMLLQLRGRLGRVERRSCPFDEGSPPRGAGVHWVEPRLVAEIAFGEWTQNGLLRQPRFEGLRPDKTPKECRRERPKPARSTVRR